MANQDISGLQDQINLFQTAFSSAWCALLLVISHSSCISATKAFLCKPPSQKLPFWSCLSSLLCCHPTQTDPHPSWECPWVPAPVLFWKSFPERGERKLAFGCFLWPWHVPAGIRDSPAGCLVTAESYFSNIIGFITSL